MEEAEAVVALLRADADPDIGDRRALTPLHVASRAGASGVVGALLEHGAAVDARDNERGWTPLHEAVSGRHADVARLLLESGADPDAGNGVDPPSPLGFAVSESSLELARLLVDGGADGSLDYGDIPLIHEALQLAHDEDPEMIRLLVDAGARLDQRDREGRTVLEAAREYLGREKEASWIAKRQRVLEALESMETDS
jgi:ankyrin repeat protein